VFFDHFHSCLLKSLETEDVKHRFDLSIEVEKLGISVIDLSGLAVLLCWHLWLEEGHRGSIKIEFSSDAHFLSRRLICEVLNIFISLDEEMLASVNGLWGWDVTVRVDGNDSFWGLYSEDTSGYVTCLNRLESLPWSI